MTLAEQIKASEVRQLEGTRFLYLLSLAHSEGLLGGLLEKAGVPVKRPRRSGLILHSLPHRNQDGPQTEVAQTSRASSL